MNNNEAWEKLFEKYDIHSQVNKYGIFEISANQIKEFREPRLMTKFDTYESRPSVFGNKLTILPNSRGTYLIGNFDTYRKFPNMVSDIHHVEFPDYLETINKNQITSEANAINVMSITNILNDFLQEDNMLQTISGRMSSGSFDFNIYDTKNKNNAKIAVHNSQIEIDGGFENQNIIAIIEGKNVFNENFLVRQLYYPYRCWQNKVTKIIKPIFMIYSNNIFRLMEFEFQELNNYSSISFLHQKNYSFEETKISMQDLMEIYLSTCVKPEPVDVPFIQANSFNTAISILEMVRNSPLTTEKIAENIGFKQRQSDYYYNACKYLGLAEKSKNENGNTVVTLTKKGRTLLDMPYKKRQLQYVSLMLEHEILTYAFEYAINEGKIPDNKLLEYKIRELKLCEDSADRRASTVSSWIKWIFDLINE
ncbi:MAG: hypothetical protein WC154_07840 [Candidatus Izemoplasmatales bacterium]